MLPVLKSQIGLCSLLIGRRMELQGLSLHMPVVLALPALWHAHPWDPT